MSSGTTAVVLNDFNEKGVIEIIFIDEILAKFLCTEDNGQWHHIMVCTATIGFIHNPLVWAIALSGTKAMREASSIG
jgi:hypothetical protein